jgi:prepilin-type N-terminal cleavage/methylation domain-containing protein
MRKYDLRGGFTLIELLIVIAIILILIAIALPNFLEAQIRAKVAQAKGHARTIGIAEDAYYLDWGVYTTDHDWDDRSQQGLKQLTTPLQYLPAIPHEPFSTANGLRNGRDDEIGWEMGATGPGPRPIAESFLKVLIHAYAVYSFGPSLRDEFDCSDVWPKCTVSPEIDPCLVSTGSITTSGKAWTDYAPTNGTKSIGVIVQAGGEVGSGNYCINRWQRVKGFFKGPT